MSTDKPIKIMIADDHQMVVDGLVGLLAMDSSVKVIGEALNGKNLLDLLNQNEPDQIIIDINMPIMDGIQVTKYVKVHHPDIKVLILTMYNKPEFIRQMLEVGADGFILKNTGRDELLNAIHSLDQGRTYYGKEVMAKMMESIAQKQEKELPEITAREKDILKLLVQEYTTQEIAEKLFISTHTVDTHRKNLLSKLNVKNTVGLVRYAFEHGLVD